ncbi:cytochrome C biogenesis protein [Leptospira ilyithenensis]|uniref:Cytochrome c-type biogenesis protein n=2 Tax=Leptospira ilyithenensis TaxID=2484901 RepID=A0A4R9LJY6_9LEPT|nr:cytochrome C biogenesis protein [Leptospira ilyithenensis]
MLGESPLRGSGYPLQSATQDFRFYPFRKITKLFKTLIALFLFGSLSLSPSGLMAQKTTTNLKDPAQIKAFHEATERIRCICLPSLPIQACSFNMCSASSYLKSFIENRIREGMSSEEIVNKMQGGFGEGILTDSVVKHFVESGNQGMVDSLVYGFGPKILATPDSTWINFTLFGLGALGLGLIYFYFAKFKPNLKKETITKSTDLTTEEISRKIKNWENSEG